MKKFWIVAIQALALCIATPGAYSDDSGNGHAYGVKRLKGKPLKNAKAEAAAQTVNSIIANEVGAESEQYLEYSRKLAETLSQKSSSEVAEILGSSNTHGLGY